MTLLNIFLAISLIGWSIS